ncbi:MAG: hypothetical protein WDW36_008337 [Sanguina aurantia]
MNEPSRKTTSSAPAPGGSPDSSSDHHSSGGTEAGVKRVRQCKPDAAPRGPDSPPPRRLQQRQPSPASVSDGQVLHTIQGLLTEREALKEVNAALRLGLTSLYQGKSPTSSEELKLRISKAERFANEQILLTGTLNARLAALQAELLGVHPG